MPSDTNAQVEGQQPLWDSFVYLSVWHHNGTTIVTACCNHSNYIIRIGQKIVSSSSINRLDTNCRINSQLWNHATKHDTDSELDASRNRGIWEETHVSSDIVHNVLMVNSTTVASQGDMIDQISRLAHWGALATVPFWQIEPNHRYFAEDS